MNNGFFRVPAIREAICRHLSWVEFCVLQMVSRAMARHTLGAYLRGVPRNLQVVVYGRLRVAGRLSEDDVIRYGLEGRESIARMGLSQDFSVDSLKFWTIRQDVERLRAAELPQEVASRLIDTFMAVEGSCMDTFRLLVERTGSAAGINYRALDISHIEVLMDMGMATAGYAECFTRELDGAQAARALARYRALFPDTSPCEYVTTFTSREVALLVAREFPITHRMPHADREVAIAAYDRCPRRMRPYYSVLAGRAGHHKISVQTLEAALIRGCRSLVRRATRSGSYNATRSECIHYAIDQDTVSVELLAQIRGLTGRVLEACVAYRIDLPIRRRSVTLSMQAVRSHDDPAALRELLPRPDRYPYCVMDCAVTEGRKYTIRDICRRAPSINISIYLQMLPIIRRPASRLSGRLTLREVNSVRWNPAMRDPLSLVPKRCSFSHRDAIITCAIVSDPKMVTMRKYGHRVICRDLLRRSIVANNRDDLLLLIN